MNEVRLYRVGGCVRDQFLGRKAKDIDFAVEADSFDAMRGYLVDRGFTIFLETPQFLTIRARFPKVDGVRRAETADFVLCRRDGPSTDGRRPDFVEPGTILDDLARRDFTMNAIAIAQDVPRVIDPHRGRKDIEDRVIRFVGDPMDRIKEDGLRVLRALRFTVTLGFKLDLPTLEAICDPVAATLLGGTSAERRREELHKMFRADTLEAMDVVAHIIPVELRDAIIEGIRLEPTMRDM